MNFVCSKGHHSSHSSKKRAPGNSAGDLCEMVKWTLFSGYVTSNDRRWSKRHGCLNHLAENPSLGHGLRLFLSGPVDVYPSTSILTYRWNDGCSGPGWFVGWGLGKVWGSQKRRHHGVQKGGRSEKWELEVGVVWFNVLHSLKLTLALNIGRAPKGS